MKTLWSLVDSEAQILGDLVEKRPSKVARSDPNAFSVKDDIPLKEKVIQLLGSDLLSQVCWALSKIGRLLENRQIDDSVIDSIPQLFKSQYAKLEYSAVLATISILKIDAERYKTIFLVPICQRLSQRASAEYAVCLKLMAKFINEQEATEIIWPTILKILEKNQDSCSHCALTILTFIPGANFKITKSEFSMLFEYPLFVNEYLIQVTSNFLPVYGEDWLYDEVPEKLTEICSKNEVYRKGFTTFIAKYPSLIKTQSLYSKIMDCFSWSENDMDIALILLAHADNFMQSRYTSLATSILTLARTVASSKNHKAQIKLFSILLEQDYLLNGTEYTTKYLFEALGNEKDIDVTLAFINNADGIFKKTKLQAMKNIFLSFFSAKFSIQNQKVKEALAFSPMLSTMHEYGSHANTGHVVDLCEYFYNRWRYFTKCMNAIALYTPLSLHSYTTKLLNIVESAATLNPQVLTDVVVKFYLRIILEFTETISQHKFLDYLWKAYGESSKYELRRLYIREALELIKKIPDDLYMKHIWAYMKNFKNEKCSLVRVKLMEYFLIIDTYYSLSSYPQINVDITNVVEAMSEEKDPQAHNMIKQVKAILKPVYVEPPRTPIIPKRPNTPSKLPILVGGRTTNSPRNKSGRKNESHVRSASNPVRKSGSMGFRPPKPIF